MLNTWMEVPLSEYEQHMNSVDVQQMSALSNLFAETINRCHPSSIAILGIAGGNGLDSIDRAVTARVVGFDLNPHYLDAVRQRYSHMPRLELHCVDLSEHLVDVEPVQLVHAALIFEHAGVEICLENALSMIAPGGILSVVLQLPAECGNAAVKSPFSSIENLKFHFSLINSELFCELLRGRGLRLIHETRRGLPAGKSFWTGTFSTLRTRER